MNVRKLILIGCVAGFFVLCIFSLPAHASACTTSGYPDGCSGAPTGVAEYPNLLNSQQVVMLNILGGSGYTNGTYSWTATGCGGSGAAGTVTVSGGKVGGSYGGSYTITNEGSGYTCRPTIAIPSGAGSGSGASITPSVYQAVPPWNAPGVDYYVGVPSNVTLQDPTNAANLPSGATYSSNKVTITGCNVTINGFDFSSHNANLTIDAPSGCTTTVENSKFSANANGLENILISSGNLGSYVIEQNEFNGEAPPGSGGSGVSGWEGEIIDNASHGNITLLYNYCHDVDSKCIQVSGGSTTRTFTEKYNLFANIGTCAPGQCPHGEAEYTYASAGSSLAVTFSYNTYLTTFFSTGGDASALQAVQADDVNITGSTDDHNVILAPGPETTCYTYNQTAYTGSADIFNGQQEGGAESSITFAYNYLDNSGTYFPWYPDSGSGDTFTGNVDAGGGGACNGSSNGYDTTPSTPTGLNVTGTTSSTASLSWNASTDGTVGITGYKIYRGGVLVGTSGFTNFTDLGLTASTTYSYTVSAYDVEQNSSGKSSAVNATTQSGSVTITSPSTPTNLAVVGTTTSTASLSWNPSTAGTYPIAGYYIYRNGSQVATTANTSYTDTNLAASTTYSYAIVAYDTMGNTSSPSASVNATTQIIVINPPTTPTGLAKTGVTTSTVSLSWNPSSGGTYPISGYKIYRNAVQVGTIPIISYTDTNLAASTTYSYTIAAYDTMGNTSGQSSAVVASTLPISNGTSTPSSTAPIIISFSATPSTITDGQSSLLSWVTNGNPAPTLSISGIGQVTGLSIQVTPGQTTTYTLTAQNTAGSTSTAITVTVNPVNNGGGGGGGSSGGGSSGGGSSGGGGGGGGGPIVSNPSSTPISGATSTMTVSSTITLPTTNAGLEALLTSLLSELNALISQLNTSLVGNFTSNLTIGSTGAEVKDLQLFLNDNGYPIASSGVGSPGNESTYFGAKTGAALGKWQQANGLPDTGFLGPLTIQYMKKKW